MRSRLRPLVLPIAALLAAAATGARAQETALPFRVGELLEYRVRVARVGDVGKGRMWVEGPEDERGTSTWRLRFEVEAGKGPFRGVDRTSSWLDPLTFSITRFRKEERHMLSRSREDVLIHPDSGTWHDLDGDDKAAPRPLGAAEPLDELSFIYFLRTLPLDRDTTMTFERHFDPARNPTIVRVVGNDTIKTPAGIFHTRVVEMEVRDPKHYRGTGTIRIHFSEGDCRVPVRIESRMPVLGATTLTLTGWSHPPRYPDAIVC